MSLKLEKLKGVDVFVLKESGKDTGYRVKKLSSEYKSSVIWWKVFKGERSLGSFDSQAEAVSFLRKKYIEELTTKYYGKLGVR